MRGQLPSEGASLDELAELMACSAAPLAALLDLAMRLVTSCEPAASGAAVLKMDVGTDSWTVLVSTAGVDDEIVQDLALSLAAVRDRDRTPALFDVSQSRGRRVYPIQGGLSLAIDLYAAGRLVGVLIVLGCSPTRWSAVPSSVAASLRMCLTGAVLRETERAGAALIRRAASAIRRLFEEGAQVIDVEEAGGVLARVVADVFETERTGMYLVDGNGVISFAIGLGLSAELSDALATSLLGKVASESPAWQSLQLNIGATLVDDSATVNVRPGGFVETLGVGSYAAIPLLSKTGLLGMVISGDVSARTWTDKERELAEQFALEGALIVDAARLRASEREQLQRITHQAYHDGLTGVPNRSLFMDRAEQALVTADRFHTSVAMLLLDLNDFKQVNDTLGHRYGDELLQEVAERLNRSVREGDVVARLGGDEFAILVSGDAGVAEAYAVAAKVDALLSNPVNIGAVMLNAVASIGIAVFPDHARNAVDLVQRADIAMYAAKRSGNGPTVYAPSQDDATVDKLTLYTELLHAIAGGELRLAFQPKLDLQSNRINGVEALVRWQHPRRGLLGPADFLPTAESTGLIHSITAWVVRQALAEWTEWNRSGVTLDLAINISARDLTNRDFLTQTTDVIIRAEAARSIILEVTETAVMRNPQESARALAAFRNLGVRTSMDDFGAGYSSLTQLTQLPFDELKIDRLLVRDVESNGLNRALMETVVDLGHRLGLTVVAEGVETAEALLAVGRLHCDVGQGYFISRPLSADDMTDLLHAGRVPPFGTHAVTAS